MSSTKTLTERDIAAIRERDAARTPPAWQPDPMHPVDVLMCPPGDPGRNDIFATCYGPNQKASANAAFIAGCSTDIPALLAALDNAHGLIADLQKDEGYRRGFADALRQVLAILADEPWAQEEPPGWFSTLMDMIAALGPPAQDALPPDRCREEVVRLRAVLRSIALARKDGSMASTSILLTVCQEARDALGEEQP